MDNNSNNNSNNYNYVLLLPLIIVTVDDASLAQVHRDTYNAPVVCFKQRHRYILVISSCLNYEQGTK